MIFCDVSSLKAVCYICSTPSWDAKFDSGWMRVDICTHMLRLTCILVRLCPCGSWASNGPIAHPPVHEWMWSSSGVTLTGKNRRTRRKTCPSITWSTTNPIRTALGANPDFCGAKPENNGRVTARPNVEYIIQYIYTHIYWGPHCILTHALVLNYLGAWNDKINLKHVIYVA
jgi:hypothetical protein